MIPQITDGLTPDIIIYKHPGRTFRFTNTNLTGFIDGREAIEQAIWHILMIERYAYPIYGDNYGREFQQYIGSSIDFIRATIQDTLSDALLQDDRILQVRVLRVEPTKQDSPYEKDKSQVAIDFEIFTTVGRFNINEFLIQTVA